MRRRTALAVAAVLLAGGAVAPHVGAAVVGPTVTTADAVVTEQGFDTASAPPTSTIRAWAVSPYRAVNMYFSGTQRYDMTQSELSPLWVTTVLANGWEIIPTVVDLQAPCYSGKKSKMSTDPTTAQEQGTSAADDAVNGNGALATTHTATPFSTLGIGKGAIAYIDIEPYTVPSGDTTCKPAIRAFLAGWTSEMHTLGYRAGVYSRPVDAIALLVAKRSDASYPQPDAIWFARWDGVATTASSDIPSDYLPNHRVHQYLNTTESYVGTAPMGIDKDALGGNAVTASSVSLPSGPPYTYAASPDSGSVLHERTCPSTSCSKATTTYDKAVPIQIMCQAAGVPGDANGVVHGDYVWDKLVDGNYVSDLYTDTTGRNGFSRAIARCDTTAPTVSTRKLGAATLHSSVTVAWAGSDADSGVASYDMRWRRAAYNGGYGSWHYVTTTATSTPLAVSPGYTYCVQVRATDRSGNTSAYTAPTCIARALDDRALLRTTTGWTRATWRTYYFGTYTTTTGYHRTLSRTGVQLRTVGVVVTQCPTCGRIVVLVAGKRVGNVIDLYASSTTRKRIILLPSLGALTSGTVTVQTVSSGKPVKIDGLVVSRY